ncbi:DUF4174 domain-containing protein [Pseudooceanicola sp.]|uniref:DUF4174 domain-containing protein n=1 Tax=Pseudooceanicola sp. TaxID=1914328 RepID=UPI0035C708B6
MIRLPALALLMTATVAQATTGTVFRDLDPDTADLSDYRGSERLVVIFAPSLDDPKMKQALAALRLAEPGLDDRDVVVLTDTSPEADSLMREKLNPEGFTMLLVGKDGGIKMRTQDVMSPEEIFATIDAMPMRRQEMQED